MPLCLLDTDILSELLRLRNANVLAKALAYTQQHGQLAISAITRYEVNRGYKDSGATTQVVRFAAFCSQSLVLPVTDAVLDRAADLWVLARQGGHPRGDADLIIAATALESGRVLVTGNTAHFAWIPGLTIEDWRQP
jgi:tRNA(fMet)-specific endonuclease VapC